MDLNDIIVHKSKLPNKLQEIIDKKGPISSDIKFIPNINPAVISVLTNGLVILFGVLIATGFGAQLPNFLTQNPIDTGTIIGYSITTLIGISLSVFSVYLLIKSFQERKMIGTGNWRIGLYLLTDGLLIFSGGRYCSFISRPDIVGTEIIQVGQSENTGEPIYHTFLTMRRTVEEDLFYLDLCSSDTVPYHWNISNEEMKENIDRWIGK